MDIKEIQNLIKFVSKSGVTEVAIEQGDFKITIKTDQIGEHVVVQQPVMAAPQQVAAPQVTTQAAPVAAETPAATEAAETPASSNLIEIKSPMIGTFYRKSAPEKPAFVNVGDTIKPGDVLCIVEAMKLFNEIESEVAGKIVKVLVDDTTPIEYDQPLFLVEPA
ncbi:acetyl-CoA carboxylase biotin carboxyl carrier protein [Paracrocinitomix mangrovi]|uniref:acetyl-CoA carboxylase biotin carboxyl carrier protein n=1 Tax=Paracrocinitomix mangrovi TaxID=2862509 RepID=UPI001C8E281C|nr:acetyl-CoA carboxylase biotin carboxyl carrier protein [Paracrocinitomix mangrovi]UKN00852.1 acetyl-CoA carboxylase biotin carboxyl carrier protein [Paracrocinitomix mangrovi]